MCRDHESVSCGGGGEQTESPDCNGRSRGGAGAWGCQRKAAEPAPESAAPPAAPVAVEPSTDPQKFLNQPLVTHVYTADPSAHVFRGKLYVYPSHDIESGVTPDHEGSHFDMRDYHVFSMESPTGEAVDRGIGLDIKSVPWAKRQVWAPNVAERGASYYLYFPAKDMQDVFRIGVAVADNPVGPFVAQPEPVRGAYSVDPADVRGRWQTLPDRRRHSWRSAAALGQRHVYRARRISGGRPAGIDAKNGAAQG